MALEIPLTVRNRGVQRPTGSGRLILATAKTSALDISEQEGNFLVNVSIGTPPQNFRLLVSHDASVTYVLGKDCDTGVCPDHAKFDGSKSSTYKQLTKDLQCCVDRGYAVLATDNIVLGDVTIPQATFAIAVNSSVDPKNRDSVHYDGVLGLGLFTQTESVENVEPILTTAHKQDAVGQSMYTVWLQRQNGGDCEESKAFLPVRSEWAQMSRSTAPTTTTRSNCKAQTPDNIRIVMDGTEYVIPGKHLIDRFDDPRTCSLNIMAFDLVGSDKYYNFVIGSPFLREYCQTYDAANEQIGFSKNTDTTEMDTQKVCSGAPTFGLSAVVVATLFAAVAV